MGSRGRDQPNRTRYGGQLIDAREPRTPVWRPVYDEGVMTRVANTTDEIDADDGGWAAPRVLHLHHPSDPVGYRTWDTLWKRPDWTREPIGYDVSPRVAWYPFVTFWQVVADLMAGFNAPAGYGHNYSPSSCPGVDGRRSGRWLDRRGHSTPRGTPHRDRTEWAGLRSDGEAGRDPRACRGEPPYHRRTTICMVDPRTRAESERGRPCSGSHF